MKEETKGLGPKTLNSEKSTHVLSCNTWSIFPGKTVCRPAAKALKNVCCGIRKRRDQTAAAQQRRIAGKAETKNVITGRWRQEETAHQREWPCQGKAAEFMALLFISWGSRRVLLEEKKKIGKEIKRSLRLFWWLEARFIADLSCVWGSLPSF